MGSFKVRLYVADLIAPKDSLILPSLYHIHAGIYTANELENRCAFLETPVKTARSSTVLPTQTALSGK